MARIAGVDIPNKKRIEYALTYIYGIGHTTSVKILKKVGISLDKRVYELNEEEIATITKELRTYEIEGDLRRKVAMNIKALMDLGNYRGLRHRRVFLFVAKKQKQMPEPEKAKEKPLVRLLKKE